MAQDQDRLSSSPLLPAGDSTDASMATASISPAGDSTDAGMATAGISPARPEQLKIDEVAEAPGATQTTGQTRGPLVQQSSQDSATGGAKVNPVKLCIYTLKADYYCRITFESGRLTTAQQVLAKVREALGIPEEIEQVFSVWLTSRHLQLQLKSYHLPCKLFKRWKDLLSQFTTATFEEISEDEPILSFQRNAFLPLKEERNLLKKQKSDDPNNYRRAIDLLYHEAVFNTTRGRYPLSVEEFHSQAGLQAAVKHLEEDSKAPATITVGRGEEGMFYPPHMRGRGGNMMTKLFKKSPETKSLTEELTSAYQDALKKCEDPHQLKILYLQLCWHKPYYGSVFFKGIVEKPPQYLKLLSTSEKRIVVAVNMDCVHLMTARSPSDVLLYLTFDQLSWEFQAPDADGEEYFSSLLLEFDSVLGPEYKKVAKRVQIFSRQAPMMDAMIARCVACINKQEEELRRLRLEQGNEEFLEHSIKTYEGESPRVQRQEFNYKEYKLQCTVLSAEGEPLGSGFTLSRVHKKKSKGDVGASGAKEDTAPLTQGSTEMSNRALEEGAHSSAGQGKSVTSDV